MKSIDFIAVAVLVWQSPAWAGGWHYEIRSNRLECDFCAYDLEQKFMKIKGITNYEVDLDGIFIIDTSTDLRFTEQRLKNMLLDEGFDYNGMTERAK